RTEWLRSEAFNEIGSLIHHDHPLVAWQQEGPPGRVLGLALHKAWGESNFSDRDRNRLHLFNVELHQLFREGKMKSARQRQPKLSPRQKQVLDRLLAGDSVKQAAVVLGISHRTVEDYVKALYRIFSVNSRGELMALFLRWK